MGFIFTTKISKNLNRNFIRDLLSLVKRHKTNLKKGDKDKPKPPQEDTVEESFNSLNAQSERLEKNLKWFFCQNKKILEDNRYIISNVLKSKHDNNEKLKNVFTYAFSMLHLLDKNPGVVEDNDINGCQTSIDSVNSQLRTYSEDLKRDTGLPGDKENCSKHNGFRRRINPCDSEIINEFKRVESNQS